MGSPLGLDRVDAVRLEEVLATDFGPCTQPASGAGSWGGEGRGSS